MKKWIFALILSAGCFHATDPDDDLCITPVTNNPYVVPNHGSGIPMMGAQ